MGETPDEQGGDDGDPAVFPIDASSFRHTEYGCGDECYHGGTDAPENLFHCGVSAEMTEKDGQKQDDADGNGDVSDDGNDGAPLAEDPMSDGSRHVYGKDAWHCLRNGE